MAVAIGLVSGAGCAPGGSPIVAGPRHLGIGWFVQREPFVAETSGQGETAPFCIDVKGIGLLFSPGRCSVGYARTNFVAVHPGDDAQVRLSGLEVFTGRRADAHARAWPPGGVPSPPTYVPSINRPSPPDQKLSPTPEEPD
jgi:hypothetical protein